jgi:hypothetical protein
MKKSHQARSQNCEKRVLALSCLSVCLSACLPVRPSAMNNSAPTARILMKFDISVFFRKYVDRIQISLKSDKKSG